MLYIIILDKENDYVNSCPNRGYDEARLPIQSCFLSFRTLKTCQEG